MGGRRPKAAAPPPLWRRPPEAAASSMDGCGEAGEAQGILKGSFHENFSATSWESCATSSQLCSNFVTNLYQDCIAGFYARILYQSPSCKKSKSVLANTVAMGHNRPEIHKRSAKIWKPFWHFWASYGSKSNISIMILYRISARFFL